VRCSVCHLPGVVGKEHDARKKVIHTSDRVARQKEHYREFDDLEFANVYFKVHFHALEVFT